MGIDIDRLVTNHTVCLPKLISTHCECDASILILFILATDLSESCETTPLKVNNMI